MFRRFECCEGWVLQAFSFALDPSVSQRCLFERFFGARRFVHNWAVQLLRDDYEEYKKTGVSGGKPSLRLLRKRWNVEKDAVAVDSVTGEPWWRDVSRRVFEDGIEGAVGGYWRWQKTRNDPNPNRRAGLPKLHKKNKAGIRSLLLVTARSRYFVGGVRCMCLTLVGLVPMSRLAS